MPIRGPRSGPSRLAAAATYFHSLFRIVAGFLFWCHGCQKIFGVWGGHKAPMVSRLGAAGLLELIGGILIMLGLFTRPTALVLFAEMVVAYATFHAQQKGVLPIQNGGELAILYAVFFLWLVFAGPGAASIDAALRRRP